MSGIGYLDDNRPISPPTDKEATISAVANTLKQTLLDFRCDPWTFPKLTKCGLFAPANGAAFLTFWLFVNGSLTELGAFTSRNSAPDDDTFLPYPLIIPRFARVQLQVDNTDPANAYSVTGRVVVQYFDHW